MDFSNKDILSLDKAFANNIVLRDWEIEAHGREVGLFVRYCEDNKLAKYKWTKI